MFLGSAFLIHFEVVYNVLHPFRNCCYDSWNSQSDDSDDLRVNADGIHGAENVFDLHSRFAKV